MSVGHALFTMQWSHDSDSCMVFRVVCPAPGKGKSVLDAWVTAINDHQGEDNAREAGGHGKVFFVGLRAVLWIPLFSSGVNGPGLSNRWKLLVGRT